jgi:hypothetical protein
MKTRSFFLFFLILFPVLVWSQGPGYLGKKTVIGYGAYLSPVIYGSTASNKTLIGNKNGSAETGHLRFNYTHVVFAERVLSTHGLLGVSLNYIRTGYDNRSDLSDLSLRPTDYYTIKAFTFMPYFKRYFRSYVAPWGKYLIVGPSLSMMTSKHDAFMYSLQTVNNHDTLINDFGSDSKKHFSADVLLGYGRNRIFNNKISLDYGFSFHLLSALTTVESFNSSPSGGMPSREQYISETIKFRMRAVNRFNLFIKVGYLF